MGKWSCRNVCNFPSGKWMIENASLKEKDMRAHILLKQFKGPNHADFLSLQPKEFTRYINKGQVRLKMCESPVVNFSPVSTSAARNDKWHSFCVLYWHGSPYQVSSFKSHILSRVSYPHNTSFLVTIHSIIH